jgi:hypothetical protein
MNYMRNACYECKQSPVAENVRKALDAISTCLSSGDRDSEREAYRQIHQFQTLKIEAPLVTDGSHINKDVIRDAVALTITTTAHDDYNNALSLIASSLSKGWLAEAVFALEMLNIIYENKTGALC